MAASRRIGPSSGRTCRKAIDDGARNSHPCPRRTRGRCNGMRSTSASRARARCACASTPSGSTSSTSITAPGSITLAQLPAVIGMEGAGDVVAVGPGVGDSQGRRPRGLCGRARRLCRGAPDRRRPARQAAGRHRLRDRRRHDAAGHDGALSAARDLSAAPPRRCCCSTRRRAASGSSPASGRSASARRSSERWARRRRRSSPATTAARTSSTTAPRISSRASRRSRAASGCDVVYDSIGKDTFPASLDCLKPKGLWVSFGNCLGPGAAVRDLDPLGQGLALCHASDAHGLHRAARRSASPTRRSCSRWWRRARSRFRERTLSAARGRRGAPRSGGAQDDGLDRAHPLMPPTRLCAVWLARGKRRA